jgi:hypothetical protein
MKINVNVKKISKKKKKIVLSSGQSWKKTDRIGMRKDATQGIPQINADTMDFFR